VGVDDDGFRALIVAREGVLGDYARLVGRLGLDVTASVDRDRAVDALGGVAPAIAILEVEDGGCALCRELRDRFGDDLPVILVSALRTEPADVVAGLLSGADDYAAEDMDPDEFVARVRRLVDRARRLSHPHLDLRRLSSLTSREREVLGMLVDGQAQKEIAISLGISSKTTGTHVQNILGKLGLHSRLEAVALAIRSSEASDRAGRRHQV
jgi:DNA-binding NarL/FixJ family response regulator